MNTLSFLQARRFDSQRFPSSKYHYVPQSAFECLQPSQYYRFVESTGDQVSPPVSIAVGDETGLLAVANDSGDVVLLESQTLKEKYKYQAHHCAIFDLKYRPGTNDAQILTASGDKNIVLWDFERDLRLHELHRSHEGSVKSISFHDTNIFASSGRDGTIKMWDLRVNVLVTSPQFRIDNPHLSTLPSTKSPRALTPKKATRSRSRNSPIATARQSVNRMASNVVTCVHFNPLYPQHLYSTGISDNAVKIWDIRNCARKFRGSFNPSPVKHHSIQTNHSRSSNGHGFSTMIFGSHCKYGNVLYASSTDNKIYAFLDNITHPVLILTGRFSNHFSRLATFGQQYLLSGSITGRALLWNTENMAPPAVNDNGQVVVKHREPLYQLKQNEQFASDVSLVATDFYRSRAIYTSSESQIIYRWSLAEDSFGNQNRSHGFAEDEDFVTPQPPKCVRFEETQQENAKPSSCYQVGSTPSVSGKRSSCGDASQTPRSSPLVSITNWMTPSDCNKRLRSMQTPTS